MMKALGLSLTAQELDMFFSKMLGLFCLKFWRLPGPVSLELPRSRTEYVGLLRFLFHAQLTPLAANGCSHLSTLLQSNMKPNLAATVREST